MMSKKNANSELTIFQLFEELKAEMAKLQSIESKAIELDLSPIEQQLEDLKEQLKNIEREKSNVTLINELQDIKRKIGRIPQPSTGVSPIELQQELNSFAKKIELVIKSRPIYSEKKDKASMTIYIDSKYIFIFIGILIFTLGTTMFMYDSERKKRISLQGNDLKYRYILMEEGANKGDLRWLENIFKTNKNDTIVSKIKQAVKLHEKSLKEEQDKE